jgi:hypothetical protein
VIENLQKNIFEFFFLISLFGEISPIIKNAVLKKV